MKKQMLWKTKGMNQDLSVSAFNPEFSFENMNLRLSTNEGNTALSWVNERGTKILVLDLDTTILGKQESEIVGYPIGVSILDHKLILFATNNLGIDSVYVFSNVSQSEEEQSIAGKLIYRGNLGFQTKYPLETLASYETDLVQKVYWTDGNNQPRVINIVNFERYYTEGSVDTVFDFIPTISLKDSVTIEQNTAGGGLFAPGVIQYCITYFNKYRQQSNIAYVSPLFYLAHSDRAASPEEKINSSFKITIENPDTEFEYLRIYSIQRTSLDATPIAKIVEDIYLKDLEEEPIDYTDNGTTGSSIDPTELLFVGGKAIFALTMAEKDKTLFMGNIKQKNVSVDKIQDTFLDEKMTPEFIVDADSATNPKKKYNQKSTSELYPYENTLKYNQEKITTFKGGEWYRFGFQLQTETGEWSEPIFINDVKNTQYPVVASGGTSYKLPYAKLSINFNDLGLAEDITSYKRIRPMVVFPTMGDREVICQGVLNPTVFNVEDRKNGTPYAQASWYFRPYSDKNIGSVTPGNQPPVYGNAAYTHYQSLFCQDKIKPSETKRNTLEYFKKACDVEIQGSATLYDTPYSEANSDVHSNTQFFVDQSIVTLNSPDIDFDTNVQNVATDNLKLRIVGAIPISSSASSHSIVTSSNMIETATNMGYNTLGKNEEPIDTHTFGIGEQNFNVYSSVGDNLKGVRMVAANIWNDSVAIYPSYANLWYYLLDDDPFCDTTGATSYETLGDWVISTHNYPANFFVHPWQRTHSLNNDYRKKEEASSWLKTKRESNLLFSLNTSYFSSVSFENISSRIHLQENEQVFKIGLPKQKKTASSISYYPNIDKTLYNTSGYRPLLETFTEEKGKRYSFLHEGEGEDGHDLMTEVKDPVEMRYKSTSHAVIALNAEDLESEDSLIPILPYNSNNNKGKYDTSQGLNKTTFWGNNKMQFTQNGIGVNFDHFLWLGELYIENEDSSSRFGGRGKEALKSNTWLVGGEAQDINLSGDNILYWTYGDTYYQRYDCLKTYAFSNEDTNQLVEILSFMCETHVNIDGRYDANRGQAISHNMSPTNFNIINDVYSQKDNFFNYKKLNTKNEEYKYPNQIVWSKTKASGAEVDLWTNVTLANTLELDGDKGQVTSLHRLNDQIITFQDFAISQILYNENVQISSTEGVPIEIANSGKVQGKRYLSDTIGCSNKWAMTSTPVGIYFMDSINKGIFLFNGQVQNISGNLGFNTWAKRNIPASDVYWNPSDFDNFVAYYDKLNQDVLFINKEKALAYSERLGAFTSFYNYEGTPYFCNFDDVGIWLRTETRSEEEDPDHYTPGGTFTTLWKHQAGDYCDFFSTQNYDGHKPYWMTLVGNPEPQIDKTFTNIEFRACVEGDGEPNQNADKFSFYLPFDSLETWNEYQHGYTALEEKSGHAAMMHGGDSSALKRKFRIWRCDIPRNNCLLDTIGTGKDDREAGTKYPYSLDADLNVSRYIRKPVDRMRNPWLYLKLQKNTDTDKKVEIHDMMMTYFT